jgi:hypothetical protein
VVALDAEKTADLDRYKGKLKGAVVLTGKPGKLRPLAELDDPTGSPTSALVPSDRDKLPFEQVQGFRRASRDFLTREGAAAVLVDAGKPFGLVGTGGGGVLSAGGDRASAGSRIPVLTVAHEQYAMLYRLATRPAPARTRVELEVSNRFTGPVAVANTVGEIRGKERPDEFVVVGAHLDSWDLGQGALDNGTGTAVVLEAARVLARCGTPPRRTIRFVLFTGEEQGLLGAKAYVARHKDELPRTSACLVHDTGTGKVVGLGWLGKADLKPILEAELAALKELGVREVHARGMRGSDHGAFHEAGVPGGHVRQEVAGYRIAHHTQADTLEMAREADLLQGAQVLAVTAMRLANLDDLLPRDKPAAGAEGEKLVPLFPEEGAPKGWLVREWNDLAKPAPAGVAWAVKDGVLQAGKQRGTWLVSEKEYGDFALEFEFKLTERGNSGVALRAPLKGDPAFDGLELQLADLRYNTKAKDSELTGGIYRAIAPTKQVYKPTEWNACRVEMRGPRLRVTLNGERIQDVDLTAYDQPVKRHDGSDAPPVKDRPRKGHLGFQHLSRDNEPVLIRNARLQVFDAP